MKHQTKINLIFFPIFGVFAVAGLFSLAAWIAEGLAYFKYLAS